jgi:NADH dehydrogenase
VESSGLDTTVFRPSVIFGPGDSSLTRFARVGRLPVVALACPDAKFQPVFVEDVVRAFADSLDAPDTIGKSYDVCGPSCYTLRQMFEYAADITGSDPAIIGLSDSFSYLEALVLEFLPGKLMTRDNYRSMKIDNVCDCNTAQSTLKDVWGIDPIAMEEVAPRYLTQDVPRERYDDFRQRAGR